MGQTTIPQAIRAVLHVGAGDSIAQKVSGYGIATVRWMRPLGIDYLRTIEGTLNEWAGSAHEEVYRDP